MPPSPILVVTGAGRSSDPVQSTDVFATALDALQIPTGSAVRPDDSRSLLTDDTIADRLTVAEWYSSANGRLLEPRYRDRFSRDLVAVRQDSLRLFAYEDGAVELYDVERDPREMRDVASERPEDVARLLHALSECRGETHECERITLCAPEGTAQRRSSAR